MSTTTHTHTKDIERTARAASSAGLYDELDDHCSLDRTAAREAEARRQQLAAAMTESHGGYPGDDDIDLGISPLPAPAAERYTYDEDIRFSDSPTGLGWT